MKVRSARAASAAALIASAAFLAVSAQSVNAQTWIGPTGDGSQPGDWNVGSNWSGGTVPDAVGAAAIFNNSGSDRNPITLSKAGATVIGSLSINDDGLKTLRIGSSSGSPLTFDAAGAGPATITLTGVGGASAPANSNGIGGTVNLNDNLVIDLAPRLDYSATAFTFIGGSGVNGPGGITKNGLGTLVLGDSVKAYEGPTVINQGRFRLNNASGLSNTSSVSVADGGQLEFDAAGPIRFGTSDSVVITLNGNGTINPPAGHGFWFPGAIRVGSNLVQTLSNRIDLPTDASVANNGASSSLTFSNVISGAGRLTFNPLPVNPVDQGLMIVSADNTYTGGTLVQGGTLQVNAGSDLGTGDVVVDGATVVNAPQGTSLAAGKLLLKTGVLDAIANTATLTLTGDTALFNGSPDGAPGGFVTLEAGVVEQVFGLVLGTTPQPPGLYNAANAPAYIQGAGSILVVPEPTTLSLLALSAGGLFVRRRRRA